MSSVPDLGADWFARSRLKLRHLSVLLAIERTRHIGRAARELNISQPAISKTLQELERAAGAALFERRANGSFPTPAGEALVRYSKEAFGALDRAGSELQLLSGGSAGMLAIGCSQSCSADVLPRAISLLKRDSPKLTVKVSYESLEVLLRELRARELDVVLARRWHGATPADLQEHARFALRIVVVCAKTHPLARSKRVTWKMLAAHPWILPPRGTALRADMEELFTLQGIQPLEAGIESASLWANSVLLGEFGALAVAPAELAHRLKDEGLFAVLPVKLPPVFGPNVVVTLRDREPTAAMTSFLSALSKVVRLL